jgi:ubiquinone/menaquinone biosynthesis C-methylase UbiE
MTDFDAKARTWDADASKVERAERVAEAIRRQLPGHASMSVLEYGCGTGLLGFALQPHVVRLTLADTSREMLAVLREKIEATGARNMTPLQLDLLTDPLPADRFDLVCTLLTLHHIPDTDAILARFHDVLAPGGAVAISDLDAEDGSFHGADVDVHHGFDRVVLERKMERAGFTGIRFTTAHAVLKDTAQGKRSFPVFLAMARRA